MEKRHRCKLCSRSFGNGRALGGHMRSHMIDFNNEAKMKQQEIEDDEEEYEQDIGFNSSTSDEDEEEEEIEEDKELLVDHEFYTLPDRESQTGSSRKRSKRVPRSKMDGFFKRLKTGKNVITSRENSSLSSISDTTEEHVARCLIMLSRDNWTRGGLEFEEDSTSKTKAKGKYICEECNKMFKSYQALGGHRASHKKMKAAGELRPLLAATEEKVHKCPFCERVFSSGQALGGHKRSHLINGGGSGVVVENLRKVEVLKIDLNLPAPDDEEISQVEVSDVC